MRQLILTLTRILITIVILSTTLLAYGFYQEYPARSFCNNADDMSLPTDIIQAAKEQGLPVMDLIEERNEILIFNHTQPFFRATCEIKFNDGGVISKTITNTE